MLDVMLQPKHFYLCRKLLVKLRTQQLPLSLSSFMLVRFHLLVRTTSTISHDLKANED